MLIWKKKFWLKANIVDDTRFGRAFIEIEFVDLIPNYEKRNQQANMIELNDLCLSFEISLGVLEIWEIFVLG